MRAVRFGRLFAVMWLLLPVSLVNSHELTESDRAFLEKKIVARWNITGKGQIEAAYARGVDILQDHPSYAAGYFDIMVSQDELDILLADGYDIKVTEPDWYDSFAAKSTSTMGGFVTWDEAVGNPFSSKLDSFSTAFPMISSDKFQIGTSIEGNGIFAIKVSDNPDIDEDEPEILFTGMHHAREPISIEVVLHTIRRLLFGYGVDPRITDLVNNREIYFVPIVNPDGYLYNEAIASSGGGNWRKNRRNNGGSPTTFGVDPNRNYAHMWGFDNQGSSSNGASDIYRGSAPFSEPENQAIRDFVNSRQFVIAVNFHSYSNLYLWPPGWDQLYGTDHNLFKAMCDSAATFNNYTPQPGWQLYVVNGDSDDWMHYGEGHSKILSITPEVGEQFWPPASAIPELVNENMEPNLLFIDLADTPERILPPGLASWIDPDTTLIPDYTLQWSDVGGVNAAATYKLRELFGQSISLDNAEAGGVNWDIAGFSSSSAQAWSGTLSFWGGTGNSRRANMTAAEYYRVPPGAAITARVKYDTESNFDYAYVEVSTDNGTTFTPIAGNITTNFNPNGDNRGNGITGTSGGVFVAGTFSLASYVGQDILIRLTYETDGGVLGAGVYFDDISPVVVYDSSVVLAAATSQTAYNVTGKLPGTYYYALTSTDIHGQVGGQTPPHAVVVNYSICDCSCHADPACDGETTVLDVIEVIDVAFRGAPATIDGTCPHDGRTDLDCSGDSNIIDVVQVIEVAFRSGDPEAIFCDPCQ